MLNREEDHLIGNLLDKWVCVKQCYDNKDEYVFVKQLLRKDNSIKSLRTGYLQS